MDFFNGASGRSRPRETWSGDAYWTPMVCPLPVRTAADGPLQRMAGKSTCNFQILTTSWPSFLEFKDMRVLKTLLCFCSKPLPWTALQRQCQRISKQTPRSPCRRIPSRQQGATFVEGLGPRCFVGLCSEQSRQRVHMHSSNNEQARAEKLHAEKTFINQFAVRELGLVTRGEL